MGLKLMSVRCKFFFEAWRFNRSKPLGEFLFILFCHHILGFAEFHFAYVHRFRKLQSLKSQIKALDQKKITLIDTNEIKAVNKQINALQEEFGRLREEIQYRRSYEKSVEREFVHCVAGDE